MKDYTLADYDDVKAWIDKARDKKIEWTEIVYARHKDEDGLQKFLSDKYRNGFLAQYYSRRLDGNC